jgi:uncharacterized protein (DUF3820 family)
MSTYYNTPDDIADYSDFEMPFGKHSGDPITEVPPQYLRWMYNTCNFQYYPELQRAIEHRLKIPADPHIRLGTAAAAQPPAQTQPSTKVGQMNGHVARTAWPETGIDGFRKAFDRCRREALMEYQDEPEITQLLEDVLARVQHALGI